MFLQKKALFSTQIAYETQKKDEQLKDLAKEKESSIQEAKSNSIKLWGRFIIKYFSNCIFII